MSRGNEVSQLLLLRDLSCILVTACSLSCEVSSTHSALAFTYWSAALTLTDEATSALHAKVREYQQMFARLGEQQQKLQLQLQV